MSERLADGNGRSAVDAELARLRAENARLLRLLRLTRREAAPPGPGQSGLFEAPPGLVHAGSPPDAKVALFGSLFAAQYARRILRPYPGKTTAEVHDYHDTATGVLAASLAKRAPGYTSLGFPDPRRITHTPSAGAAREIASPPAG